MSTRHLSSRRLAAATIGSLVAGAVLLNSLSAFAQGRPDDRGDSHGQEQGQMRQDHGQDRGRGPEQGKSQNGPQGGSPFADNERSAISGYYGKLPPGQVKHGRIPPGHQVVRGGTLPVGYGAPLPPGLQKRLPPRPGYERVVVGSDVLLVEIASRVIVDILTGAVK
ncbi:hypothetical protein [Insolitispirillum peregrinum]|uniref:hypothetical protein n=1 Tax=Insolitispirillum peregrinum TaxID=80876 RepID=UPI003611C4C6